MHATILAAARRLALPQPGGHFQPPVWRVLVMTDLRFFWLGHATAHGVAVARQFPAPLPTSSTNAHLETHWFRASDFERSAAGMGRTQALPKRLLLSQDGAAGICWRSCGGFRNGAYENAKAPDAGLTSSQRAAALSLIRGRD